LGLTGTELGDAMEVSAGWNVVVGEVEPGGVDSVEDQD
jgi:hypothetical protein